MRFQFSKFKILRLENFAQIGQYLRGYQSFISCTLIECSILGGARQVLYHLFFIFKNVVSFSVCQSWGCKFGILGKVFTIEKRQRSWGFFFVISGKIDTNNLGSLRCILIVLQNIMLYFRTNVIPECIATRMHSFLSFVFVIFLFNGFYSFEMKLKSGCSSVIIQF